MTHPVKLKMPVSIVELRLDSGTRRYSFEGVTVQDDVVGDNVYADGVLEDDPVGYWRLGESSGAVAEDSSGNDNDGDYVA